MSDTPETMAKALRLLADEIRSPDDVPAMCLRDAAAMIERLQIDASNHAAAAETARRESAAALARVRAIKDNIALELDDIMRSEAAALAAAAKAKALLHDCRDSLVSVAIRVAHCKDAPATPHDSAMMLLVTGNICHQQIAKIDALLADETPAKGDA